MKVLFCLFFQYLFCYLKYSIRLWPKGVIHLALIVNRVLSYSCANRDGVLGVPTPSHSSHYTLFFSSSSSSLFHFSSRQGASDQMEFFHFIFSVPRTISNSIVPAVTPGMVSRCISRAHSYLRLPLLSRIYTVYSRSLFRTSRPKREKQKA